MSLVSSIIGSSQTSKAVGDLVNSTNLGITEGNNATVSAQNQVVNAGQTANNTLAGVLNQQGTALSPYTSLGSTSANNLSTALAPGGSLTKQFSFDPNTIASNPDYQFQLQQGVAALQRAGAATGTLNSSGTQQGVLNYAGGLASSEIGQAYNQALGTFQTNYGNTLNSLGLGINSGQNATNSLVGALGNYGSQASNNIVGTNTLAANYGMANANNIEQLLLDKGNAQANGSLQQGKIWSGYVGGATNSFNNGNSLVGAALGLG